MLMVVCGEDCRWKFWSLFWAAALVVTFLIMAVKLVDARHKIAQLEMAQEAN